MRSRFGSNELADHDVVAKIELWQREKVVMTPIPGSRVQVVLQLLDGASHVCRLELRAHRDAGTDLRVQVGVWSAPERSVEPVGGVVRDRRRDEADGSKRLLEVASPATGSAIAIRDQIKELRQDTRWSARTGRPQRGRR